MYDFVTSTGHLENVTQVFSLRRHGTSLHSKSISHVFLILSPEKKIRTQGPKFNKTSNLNQVMKL